MSSKESIAIIGAGASGLLCAIFCAKSGLKVELFEQNSKCGKKILVSGNGRCNISNSNLSVDNYFGNYPNFVKYALEQFNFKKFENFTHSIGLLLNKLEDGRVYPLSNEAKSVVKIFEDYAKDLGVIFYTNTKITDIKSLIKEHSHVVVATGSRAAPHLGGNSDAELFAKVLNHTIIQTYPSLVQLHLNSHLATKMSGTKQSAEVTLFLNHQKEITVSGDILFTNYGISGFAILDISQKASLALINYNSVTISLNLLPTFTLQKLSAHLLKLTATMPTFTILDILIGLVPLKIANAILEALNISNNTLGKMVQTKLTKKIANTLLNWRFEVTETHGFRHAEVSGGGIDTTEIDPKTMQSLKQKNVYFCGELLDIVGKRGGYNFAWAWASAYVAAQDIVKKSKKRMN